MRTSKKVAIALLTVGCLTAGAFGMTACGQGEKGDKGDQGAPGAAGQSAYEIWLSNNHTGSEEAFLEWLRGEKGADGKDGAPGAPGEKGEDGAPGTPGKNGADGTDGADGATWITGTADPTAGTQAKVGDLYFNSSTCDVFELTNSGWSKLTNLRDSHIHTYSAPVIIKEAENGQTGLSIKYCTVCGVPVTETVAANHKYDNWKITVPTETQEGSAVGTCVYDHDDKHDGTNNTKEVVLPVLTSGDYHKETVETDCVTDGYTTYTYQVEGSADIVFTVYGDKAYGHKHGEDDKGTITAYPSTDGETVIPGTKDYTCTVCGEVYSEEFGASGEDAYTLVDSETTDPVTYTAIKPGNHVTYFYAIEDPDPMAPEGTYCFNEQHFKVVCDNPDGKKYTVTLLDETAYATLDDVTGSTNYDGEVSFSAILEEGEEMTFTLGSSATVENESSFESYAFIVTEEQAPALGTYERPAALKEGENTLSAAAGTRVYFKYTRATLGEYISVTFGDSVSVYGLEVRKDGAGTPLESGTTLETSPYANIINYLAAESSDGSIVINVAKVAKPGTKSNPVAITLDESVSQEYASDFWFKFTPETSGKYVFEAAEEGSLPYFWYYGADKDGAADEKSRKYIAEMEAGITYYIVAKDYDENSGAQNSGTVKFKVRSFDPSTDTGLSATEPRAAEAGETNVAYEGVSCVYYIFEATAAGKLSISVANASTTLNIYDNTEFTAYTGSKITGMVKHYESGPLTDKAVLAGEKVAFTVAVPEGETDVLTVTFTESKMIDTTLTVNVVDNETGKLTALTDTSVTLTNAQGVSFNATASNGTAVFPGMVEGDYTVSADGYVVIDGAAVAVSESQPQSTVILASVSGLTVKDVSTATADTSVSISLGANSLNTTSTRSGRGYTKFTASTAGKYKIILTSASADYHAVIYNLLHGSTSYVTNGVSQENAGDKIALTGDTVTLVGTTAGTGTYYMEFEVDLAAGEFVLIDSDLRDNANAPQKSNWYITVIDITE